MNYAVGDTVTYTVFGGGLRTGVIVEKFDDVKNGLPGFDMRVEDDGLYPGAGGIGLGWGYDDQIVSVIPA